MIWLRLGSYQLAKQVLGFESTTNSHQSLPFSRPSGLCLSGQINCGSSHSPPADQIITGTG